MDKLLIVVIIFVIPGLILILYPLYLRSGRGNKIFFMRDNIFTGYIYGSPPWGITFLIFAIAAIPQSKDISLAIIYMGGGFLLLGVIFAGLQPSFLKPLWLKWLEREHGEIMPLLREEADRMGLNVWNERMQTQVDLEDWVAEVRRKYEV